MVLFKKKWNEILLVVVFFTKTLSNENIHVFIIIQYWEDTTLTYMFDVSFSFIVMSYFTMISKQTYEMYA